MFLISVQEFLGPIIYALVLIFFACCCVVEVIDIICTWTDNISKPTKVFKVPYIVIACFKTVISILKICIFLFIIFLIVD